MLTAIAIFLVFGSVVVVLWVGAQDVLAGRMTPGRLRQFVLYAVFAAGALGELRRSGARSRRPPARPSGCSSSLPPSRRSRRPRIRVALPEPPRGEVAFEDVRFAYPTGRTPVVLDDLSF